MAVLGATSLTGCDSIPSFIAAGTKSIFNMATAPVSWTKFDALQSTLRVVNGAVLSPGGAQTFSTVFSSTRTIVNATFQTAFINLDIGQGFSSASPFAVQPSTLGNTPAATVSSAQFAAHDHPLQRAYTGSNVNNVPLLPRAPTLALQVDTQATGQSGTHTHVTDAHTHTITAPSLILHSHPNANGNGLHLHPVTTLATQNFGISYVDVIIASKD